MSNNTNEVELETVEGERGMPGVNARKPKSGKGGLAFLFLLGVVLLGLGLTYFWFVQKSRDDAAKPVAKEDQVQNSVPKRDFLNAPPPPPPPAELPEDGSAPVPAIDPDTGVASAPPAGQANANGQPAPPPPPPLNKSQSSLMVAQGSANAPAGAAQPQPQAQPSLFGASSRSGDGGGLAGLLRGTETTQSTAGYIGNRNLLIAKGATIDCVLKTRLDTTVPGMSACVVTRNIFSDNGNVLLIERGSEVIGEYSTGVQQGANRIFVLWTRVKTPNGVVIALDSPGADPLGGSGLPGHIKTHFWKRFGAAMLLSIVDDAASSLANRNRGADGTTVNLGGTSTAASDMATTTLETTINIPPTLYKNQGEQISIFVARDLDFGGVYGLRSQ